MVSTGCIISLLIAPVVKEAKNVAFTILSCFEVDIFIVLISKASEVQKLRSFFAALSLLRQDFHVLQQILVSKHLFDIIALLGSLLHQVYIILSYAVLSKSSQPEPEGRAR